MRAGTQQDSRWLRRSRPKDHWNGGRRGAELERQGGGERQRSESTQVLERPAGPGVHPVVRGAEACEDTAVGGGEAKAVRGQAVRRITEAGMQ